MTITRLVPALLLSLSLAPACGGVPDPLPAPAPDAGHDPGTAPQPPSPCAPAPVLLAASSAAPSIVGGNYADGTFRTERRIDQCLDTTIPPRPTSCASWTLSLPPAPASYDREVTLDSPILEVSGEAAVWPGCKEELDVGLWVSDDVFSFMRFLPAGPLRLTVPATRITVSACARGAAVVRVAPPSGVLRFVPAL